MLRFLVRDPIGFIVDAGVIALSIRSGCVAMVTLAVVRCLACSNGHTAVDADVEDAI